MSNKPPEKGDKTMNDNHSANAGHTPNIPDVPPRHDPPGETYRIKVKKKIIETSEKYVTGRRICELAGLIPPEKYQLDMVLANKEYQPIGLDTTLDLSTPGLEKFDYISRDQTEG